MPSCVLSLANDAYCSMLHVPSVTQSRVDKLLTCDLGLYVLAKPGHTAYMLSYSGVAQEAKI